MGNFRNRWPSVLFAQPNGGIAEILEADGLWDENATGSKRVSRGCLLPETNAAAGSCQQNESNVVSNVTKSSSSIAL
jgi:hypothetical protein